MPSSSSTSWTSTTASDVPDHPSMAAAAGTAVNEAADASPIHSTSSTASPGVLLQVKGKRTKRRRMLNLRELSPTPPPPATPPPAPPAAAGGNNAEIMIRNNKSVSPASSSSAAVVAAVSSAAFQPASSDAADEEDEDLALCLMLLAQGRTNPPGVAVGADPVAVDDQSLAEMQLGLGAEPVRKRRRRPSVLLAASAGVHDGVYECRTCNKRFSSFQALGGHRTSHTKPKVVPGGTTPSTAALGDDPTAGRPAPSVLQLASAAAAAAENVSSSSSPSHTAAAATPAPTRSNRGPRTHECSICGAEFSSGQALGGHMRRHRPLTATSASTPAESTTSASGAEEIETVTHHNMAHNEASAPAHMPSSAAFVSLDLNLPAPMDDDHSHKGDVGVGSGASASSGRRFPLVAGKPPGGVFGSTSLVADCLPLLT